MLKWFKKGQVQLKDSSIDPSQKYEEQEQWNNNLKKFVMRYQELYFGPNQVDYQINSHKRNSGICNECTHV